MKLDALSVARPPAAVFGPLTAGKRPSAGKRPPVWDNGQLRKFRLARRSFL
jgi:hypothetical protein